jgi:hypothetical protein
MHQGALGESGNFHLPAEGLGCWCISPIQPVSK